MCNSCYTDGARSGTRPPRFDNMRLSENTGQCDIHFAFSTLHIFRNFTYVHSRNLHNDCCRVAAPTPAAVSHSDLPFSVPRNHRKINFYAPNSQPARLSEKLNTKHTEKSKSVHIRNKCEGVNYRAKWVVPPKWCAALLTLWWPFKKRANSDKQWLAGEAKCCYFLVILNILRVWHKDHKTVKKTQYKR